MSITISNRPRRNSPTFEENALSQQPSAMELTNDAVRGEFIVAPYSILNRTTRVLIVCFLALGLPGSRSGGPSEGAAHGRKRRGLPADVADALEDLAPEGVAHAPVMPQPGFPRQQPMQHIKCAILVSRPGR